MSQTSRRNSRDEGITFAQSQRLKLSTHAAAAIFNWPALNLAGPEVIHSQCVKGADHLVGEPDITAQLDPAECFRSHIMQSLSVFRLWAPRSTLWDHMSCSAFASPGSKYVLPDTLPCLGRGK